MIKETSFTRFSTFWQILAVIVLIGAFSVPTVIKIVDNRVIDTTRCSYKSEYVSIEGPCTQFFESLRNNKEASALLNNDYTFTQQKYATTAVTDWAKATKELDLDRVQESVQAFQTLQQGIVNK